MTCSKWDFEKYCEFRDGKNIRRLLFVVPFPHHLNELLARKRKHDDCIAIHKNCGAATTSIILLRLLLLLLLLLLRRLLRIVPLTQPLGHFRQPILIRGIRSSTHWLQVRAVPGMRVSRSPAAHCKPQRLLTMKRSQAIRFAFARLIRVGNSSSKV